MVGVFDPGVRLVRDADHVVISAVNDHSLAGGPAFGRA